MRETLTVDYNIATISIIKRKKRCRRRRRRQVHGDGRPGVMGLSSPSSSKSPRYSKNISPAANHRETGSSSRDVCFCSALLASTTHCTGERAWTHLNALINRVPVPLKYSLAGEPKTFVSIDLIVQRQWDVEYGYASKNLQMCVG